MNFHQFYGLYDKRKRVVHFRKLLKKYIRDSKPIYGKDQLFMNRIKESFQSILPYYRNTKWHAYYHSLNNRKDIWYVPEDIFYLAVEPYLVNYDLALAYVDKNNYEKQFGTFNHPDTVLRYIKGRLYSPNLEQISENQALELLKNTFCSLIVKPTIRETGGGRGLRIFDLESNKTDILLFLKKCTEDYIIQKKISQNCQLNEFNNSSVNTFRILTFRYDRTILHLSTIARFGRAKSAIDNITGGGVFVAVKKDGQFNDYGYFENYEKTDIHPDSMKPFKGTKIDGYEKAVSLCLNRHVHLPYFDLISWDIAIDKNNEPVMIELNLINQEINFHQVTSGALFGDYSEEVIRKSIQKMKKGKYALTSFSNLIL